MEPTSQPGLIDRGEPPIVPLEPRRPPPSVLNDGEAQFLNLRQTWVLHRHGRTHEFTTDQP
jgi:hypothetical protein